MPKSISLPKLKQRLWKTFSQYIRLRDAVRTTGGTEWVVCITCGQRKLTKEVDAGHFFSRRHASILFDERNVHAQCKRCNMPPRSGEQYLYSKAIKQLYGEGELKRLEQDRESIKKFTRKELLEMEIDYKERIFSIEDEFGSPWA